MPTFTPDPRVPACLLLSGLYTPSSGSLGSLKGPSFILPSSSGDASSRIPHSFEELRGRCQPSLFPQQHPLPRSPLGSSAPAPLLGPGLPSPQDPPTMAPLPKNHPSPLMRHSIQCAALFSGNPLSLPSNPQPFCPPQLLKSALTPRLPQIHLLAPPAPCPGVPFPQNLLPDLQSPHPSPLGHPTQPHPRSCPRMVLPQLQALCGDWLASLNGGQKARCSLGMPWNLIPRGQWM